MKNKLFLVFDLPISNLELTGWPENSGITSISLYGINICVSQTFKKGANMFAFKCIKDLNVLLLYKENFCFVPYFIV